MSLITTVKEKGTKNQWVRYFVLNTEPTFGDQHFAKDEVEAVNSQTSDWVHGRSEIRVPADRFLPALRRLIDSFPGKILEEEIYVPIPVLRFLENLLFDPETQPTEEALELIDGCPINLRRLANYLEVVNQVERHRKDTTTARLGVSLRLFKVYYNRPPSLKELSALKVREFGLNIEQLKEMLGDYHIREVKKQVGVALESHEPEIERRRRSRNTLRRAGRFYSVDEQGDYSEEAEECNCPPGRPHPSCPICSYYPF